MNRIYADDQDIADGVHRYLAQREPTNRARRTIFRGDAVHRYVQGREKAVLPRFVSPRTFLFLWILSGLFVASALVAWFAQVPVYASGPAVVLDGKDETQSLRGEIVVVAFLPPDSLARLRVGQMLFLRSDPAGERFSGLILAVEPEISSPNAAQKRFALNAAAAQALNRPAAVVIARLQSSRRGLLAGCYAGSIGRADVEVGSHRVFSLLPLMGRLSGE